MSAADTVPKSSFLADIPLELRYKVFEATARSNPPEELFVHWFEKKEIADLIKDFVAKNPGAPTPIARYSRYKPEPEPVSDSESGSEDEDDEDEDDEENVDEDDSEVDSEDEEVEDEIDDEVDDEDNEQDEEDEDMALNELEDDVMDSAEQDGEMDDGDAGTANTSAGGQQGAQVHTTSAGHTGQGNAAQVDTSSGETGAAHGAISQEQDLDIEDDGDIDMADDTNADSTAAQVAPPPPPPPRPEVIRASPKWRHVAKFMKMTHCPPSMNLLLTSQQLNREAMNWYYDAAILRIQATSGSIAHTSFFEEVLNEIADAPFSPVENIRKVEVTFVWDSAWIQAQDNGDILDNILSALLRERARFILGILKRAPELKELVIHWHDSLQDAVTTDTRIEILSSFLELPASVNVKEHFIEPDAKPYKKSVAGKFRLELQGIADRGFDVFYG